MDGNNNDNNRNNDYTKDNDYYDLDLDYETHDSRGSRGSMNSMSPEGVTINPRLLEQTSRWAGILGIMTIVSGVLTCLGAITTFGISLIPGIITIILGVKLNSAKKSIDSYLRGNSQAINETFDHLGSYFKINGILIIVGLVIGVLMIMAVVMLGLAAFSGVNENMMY